MNEANVEDRKLIGAVLSGDREAFSPLMDRYYAMVYRLCLNMSGNVPDAEELAHDSFVEAYVKLGQLRDPDRFGGWLKTLSLNVCRMWYRQSQHRALELVEDNVPAVEEHSDDPEINARMSYGLSTLSPSHRLVLVLHYYEDLSYEEIATFLEVPIGTVMSRLHRAHQALKEVMTQMTEHDVIPAVPDDRFKEVVQAEITVLLEMFGEEVNTAERLAVVLRKSPERVIDVILDAEDPEMLRSLAILLPYLGVGAVDAVLDCRFSNEPAKVAKIHALLAEYAARCGRVSQRIGMSDMASREAYLLIDRLIAHSADGRAKAEMLLEMMEACKDSCPALLFANALLCYRDEAFDLLMERFIGSKSPRVMHALIRTGRRFGSAVLELITNSGAEKQSVGLAGCEAIARSLCPPWTDGITGEQFLNDVRTREKWPPLRMEDIGDDLIAEITRETASVVTQGPGVLRSQAVRVLGYLKAGEYSDLIRERLSDEDSPTRLAAIFAVSEIGDSASADALINRIRNGGSSEKAAAVAALGRLHVASAEHVLAEMTSDPHDQVREAAVLALGEMGTVSAQVALQELMRGSDRKLHKTAARALFGGVTPRHQELSEVDRRLVGKRRKVSPVAIISPDAALRFGLTEMRSYEEGELTERIASVCQDYCATRRYMIELRLMTRSGGVYEFTETGQSAWRVERFITERFLSGCVICDA